MKTIQDIEQKIIYIIGEEDNDFDVGIFRDDGKYGVWLTPSVSGVTFTREEKYKYFHGDTVEDAVEKAWRFMNLHRRAVCDKCFKWTFLNFIFKGRKKNRFNTPEDI